MKEVFGAMFIYVASNSSATYFVEGIDTTLFVEIDYDAPKIEEEKL
jgi:hypothetical protein